MRKASHFTIERPILDLAPPLPIGRGLNVEPEVHVLGQGGDDEVLPPAAAAVTVLKVIVIITLELETEVRGHFTDKKKAQLAPMRIEDPS